MNDLPAQIEFTFYATFGHGQPSFPGYLRVHVTAATEEEAENEARRRVSEATNNRWCGLYKSLDDVHPLDRVFRGEA